MEKESSLASLFDHLETDGETNLEGRLVISAGPPMGIKPEDSVPATRGDWQEIKDIMDSPEYVEGTRILGLIKDGETNG